MCCLLLCYGFVVVAIFQIQLVKSNLLKLIDVRAFSAAAEFINPCQTYILPDVICSFCNFGRDLDLCRDPQLIGGDWRCTACQQPYDKAWVEHALIHITQRRSVAYQMQDLVCTRCQQVKVENMAEFCKCSGSFRTREPKEAFLRR